MLWLTEDANLICDHQTGSVTGFSPSQSWVTVSNRRVLIDRDTVDPERQRRAPCPHHDELVLLGTAIPHRQHDITRRHARGCGRYPEVALGHTHRAPAGSSLRLSRRAGREDRQRAHYDHRVAQGAPRPAANGARSSHSSVIGPSESNLRARAR